MLALDSLVTDLIFEARGQLDPQMLADAFGGPEALKAKKVFNPDQHDPRLEMELSPSVPFRRRGEARLMFIDDSVAPMRPDPRADPVVPIDLRAAKEELISICGQLPVRLGRIFALGSWGDAVLVARSPRDLRAIALVGWALDPTIDAEGRQSASQLSKAQFEAKIMVYEKRLEELDDEDIIAGLEGVNLELRGDLIVIDVLEEDGTWDQRRSMLLEAPLAAIERFSLIPGAPSSKKLVQPAGAAADKASPAKAAVIAATKPAAPAPEPAPEPPPPPAPAGPPLAYTELGGHLLLVFPAERFDLDVAAALGKRDWDGIIQRVDNLPGQVRDRLHKDGATWVAPLEFLSEVFIEGKPLSRPVFDQGARALDGGVRALDVHVPRFGPAILLDVPGKGRFVTSALDHAAGVATLLAT